MISLRRRLSFGLTVSLVVLLVLQWVVVTYAIDRMTERQLAGRLQETAEALLAAVSFDASGELQLGGLYIGPMYERPFSGHYYVVQSGEQRKLSRSLWDADLEIAPMQTGMQRVRYLAGPDHQPLLMVASGYRKRQHEITIAVAEAVTELHTGIMRFQLAYAAISAIGLILLLVIQREIVVAALKPLQSVRARMAQLARGEVGRVDADGPEEIMPVIAELNRLLVGMSRKTKRSREALGNLAHSLKTGLTLLNQITERNEIREHPDIRATIEESTRRMGRTVERELKSARLIGDTQPGRQVDLVSEIEQLFETLKIMYAHKRVDTASYIAPSSRFVGDREDLLELLGNVLDNAFKWCRGKVTLTVAGTMPVSFVIEDDGPGCSATKLDALVVRGYRVDESKPGSGLGLAIAREIVDSYGGDLAFTHSKLLGGLRVEIRLGQSVNV
jgi:signal transduction histidine kinase